MARSVRVAAAPEFIVKVQRAHNANNMLIYDSTQERYYTGPLTADVETVLKGHTKAYFWARMRGTEIEIMYEAPWQEW